MGNSFDGEVLPMSFVCTHFKPKTPLSIPKDELCQWLGFDGASMVTPMPDATYFAAVDLTPDQDGQFQVAGEVNHHGEPLQWMLTHEELQQLLSKRIKSMELESIRLEVGFLSTPTPTILRDLNAFGQTIEHESQDAVTGFAVISSSEVENHALYGVHNRCVFIIRPDGYVGFRNENATTNDVLHCLSSQGSIQNVANDKPSVPAHDTSSWMGISLGLAMTLTFGLAPLKLSDRL
ncbi:hypothetical protein Ae201684P_013098 [Aphanomyces euteiches]|nr:hypothetical protein Ae201684P_013098 [Aphanomyces euteiches]